MRGGFVVVLLIAGCSKEEPAKASRPEWELVLKIDNTEVKVPLEALHVYLTENERYPEIFEMRGAAVTLVGEFPPDVHVGYGDKWERLFGKRVELKPEGGDPRSPKKSALTLPGRTPMSVTGGSFVVETFTGREFAEDWTLQGKITIVVDGNRTFHGRFSVNAKTWG